tara:strand:- start:266 stop:910 length:645 start_codon:yes stop_codon:yes gene_type:complete
MSRFKKTSEVNMRELIKESFKKQDLKLPHKITTNYAVCIPTGNGNDIKLFGDKIIQSRKNGIYIVYCEAFEKVNRKWVYDFDLAKIFYISNIEIIEMGINIEDTGKMYSVDVAKFLKDFIKDIDLGKEFIDIIGAVSPTMVLPLVDKALNDISLDDLISQEKETHASSSRVMNKMTCKEYAAILLQIPDSGTEWLDKMIIKSRNKKTITKTIFE